jgi:hypothetical protein
MHHTRTDTYTVLPPHPTGMCHKELRTPYVPPPDDVDEGDESDMPALVSSDESESDVPALVRSDDEAAGVPRHPNPVPRLGEYSGHTHEDCHMAMRLYDGAHRRLALAAQGRRSYYYVYQQALHHQFRLQFMPTGHTHNQVDGMVANMTAEDLWDLDQFREQFMPSADEGDADAESSDDDLPAL